MTYVLPLHIISMELGSNCNMVVLVQSIYCCSSKMCDATLDLSNTLSVCSRTYITFPLGSHPLPLLGLHCEGRHMSFLQFWMVFIHWRTVSYEGAGIPQPSFNI